MAGSHKFVFLVRGHVVLVAVAYTQESVTQVSIVTSINFQKVKFLSLQVAIIFYIHCKVGLNIIRLDFKVS